MDDPNFGVAGRKGTRGPPGQLEGHWRLSQAASDQRAAALPAGSCAALGSERTRKQELEPESGCAQLSQNLRLNLIPGSSVAPAGVPEFGTRTLAHWYSGY